MDDPTKTGSLRSYDHDEQREVTISLVEYRELISIVTSHPQELKTDYAKLQKECASLREKLYEALAEMKQRNIQLFENYGLNWNDKQNKYEKC